MMTVASKTILQGFIASSNSVLISLHVTIHFYYESLIKALVLIFNKNTSSIN